MLAVCLQIDYRHIASAIMGLHVSEELDETIARSVSMETPPSVAHSSTTLDAATKTLLYAFPLPSVIGGLVYIFRLVEACCGEISSHRGVQSLYPSYIQHSWNSVSRSPSARNLHSNVVCIPRYLVCTQVRTMSLVKQSEYCPLYAVTVSPAQLIAPGPCLSQFGALL